MAMSPPPPAMASTKPANMPTPARATRISGSSSTSGFLPSRAVGAAAQHMVVHGYLLEAPLVERNVDHRGHEGAHRELDAGHERGHRNDHEARDGRGVERAKAGRRPGK